MGKIISRIRSIILVPENNRFYNGLFFSTLSAIIFQGLNFLTLILVTRRIGESSMGHFSIIQSTVILLLNFGILGQNISAAALTSRFKKRYPHRLGLLIGNAYILSSVSLIIIGAATFISAEYLFPEIFLKFSSKYISIGIIVIWSFAMTMDMLQVSTLVGLEAYRDLIKTDVFKGLISIGLIYPLSIRYGLSGIVPGYLISSLLGVIMNQVFVRKHLNLLGVRVVFRISFNIIRRILNIGLPVFIAALFVSLATWLTNKMIFNEAGGPVALGIVFVCRQIMTLIQFFPVQISKVLLPIIAEDKNHPEKAIVKRNSLIWGVLTGIILAIFGLIFEQKILVIYNLNPEIASLPYRIILATVVFSSINMILGQFVIAGKNPWVRAYADIVISFVMITITYLLKGSYIFEALPWAMLISFILSDLLIASHIRGKSLLMKTLASNSD